MMEFYNLKCCPFCGKKPSIFKDNYNKVAVLCETCNMFFGIEIEDGTELTDGWRALFDGVGEAVAAWNSRDNSENGGSDNA